MLDTVVTGAIAEKYREATNRVLTEPIPDHNRLLEHLEAVGYLKRGELAGCLPAALFFDRTSTDVELIIDPPRRTLHGSYVRQHASLEGFAATKNPRIGSSMGHVIEDLTGTRFFAEKSQGHVMKTLGSSAVATTIVRAEFDRLELAGFSDPSSYVHEVFGKSAWQTITEATRLAAHWTGYMHIIPAHIRRNESFHRTLTFDEVRVCIGVALADSLAGTTRHDLDIVQEFVHD